MKARRFISRQNVILFSSLLLLFTLAFLLIFSRAMEKDYSRDENQFVASGVLLAREGLFPYRDYPYFHMPNLVFVYALLNTFSKYPLLNARTFSVLCASATVVLLFSLTLHLFSNKKPLLSYVFSLASAFLLLSNPVFIYTSGLAWNHDLPVLLILLAVGVYFLSQKNRQVKLLLFITGVLVGLAIGTRLSFATAAVPFLGTIFWHPGVKNKQDVLRSLLAFCAGLLVSLLPSLFTFLFSPEQFIFGNLTYARLNTLYRLEADFEGPIHFLGKLDYFLFEVIADPGNLLLLLASVFFFVSLGLIGHWSLKRVDFWFLFLTLLILFLTIGSLLPSPVWYQYFYAPVPFVILGILYGISRFSNDLNRPINLIGVLFFQIVILVTIYGSHQLSHLPVLTSLSAWYPLKVHILGHQVELLSNKGKVLTLSPLFALEGDSGIYPQFATGPFAWRVSEFVPTGNRDDLSLINPEDLDSLLSQDPPAAVLVGKHEEYEKAFIRYARNHGFREVIYSEFSLWIP